MEGKPIVVRKVYAYNLREEFSIIEQNLATYRFISVDTEFPGTIFRSQKPYHQLSPEENYQLMKENVNSLKLIQLGLTLSDSSGKLPDLGTDSYFIWEFNFCEFEEEEDLCNPDAINLLKRHGIDFVKNVVDGISFVDFAECFMESGLGFSLRSFTGCKRESDPRKLTWVFFHSTYDVGYLIKVLTQQDLPTNHVKFMALVKIYLGTSVFDVKEIVKPWGWQVGLEKVAAYLGVNRAVGQGHQAGSDSLLTMQTFMRLKLEYFNTGDQQTSMYQMFNHKLHGLEIYHSLVMRELVFIKNKYLHSRRRDHPVVVNYHCGAANPILMFRPDIRFHPTVAVQPVCSYLF